MTPIIALSPPDRHHGLSVTGETFLRLFLRVLACIWAGKVVAMIFGISVWEWVSSQSPIGLAAAVLSLFALIHNFVIQLRATKYKGLKIELDAVFVLYRTELEIRRGLEEQTCSLQVTVAELRTEVDYLEEQLDRKRDITPPPSVSVIVEQAAEHRSDA